MNKLIPLVLLVITCLMYCQQSEEGVTDAVDVNLHAAAKANYQTLCSSCHGEQMQAFVDRQWKHGNDREALYQSISVGYPDAGMPGWKATLSDTSINELVEYILTGIEQVEKYGFEEETLANDTLTSGDLTYALDTVASGFDVPWSLVFLPKADLLVSDRGGTLYRVDDKGEKTIVEGSPTVRAKGQGGLLDILLHPDFANNKQLYLSYSALKVVDGDSLTTTKVSRYQLNGNQLSEELTVLDAAPYTDKRHHFGGKLEFGKDGLLYITVGDRGERDVNPQDLSRPGGKVHRVNVDGSIPDDNPFVGVDSAIASIYSYGHRNPQGIAVHPSTGAIWTHEHGPRGGDEINISEKGVNYGWPVISYGINYNGTTFTNLLEKEGMEQPLHYWVPSIAPSGMAFVTTNKYGDWEGNLLVGSLRFKYLDLVRINGDQVISEEPLLKNIGRVRNVKVGPDGLIYVAVEKPGYIFRLIPLSI
jgi:glucose/arabinose dehydrogenase